MRRLTWAKSRRHELAHELGTSLVTALDVNTAVRRLVPIASPLRLAMRRFLANRPAVVGLIGILIIAGLCYTTLPWTLTRYNRQRLSAVLQPPGARHWMGTDRLGRDLLARFLLGGAISLAIGLISAGIAVGIGALVGLIAGYAGGRTDALLMRMVDVLYGLPTIFLVILLRVALLDRLTAAIAALGFARPQTVAGLLILLAGIGGVSWLTMARVVRSQVMSLRDQPFVEAARALGLRPLRIIGRHILPNLIGTVVVYATLTVPGAILAESFLSFLGLGVQPPLPTWGNLAAAGVLAINPIHIQWWLIFWPCAGLTIGLLCLNFLGDGLRDALDPRSR